MIQVRNVPDDLHRELTQRARRRGQTLTRYVEELLEREVSRPPIEEVLAEIESSEPVELERPVATYIRQERAERERQQERS